MNPIPDWSNHFTKAEQSLKKASDHLLAKEWDQGIAEMVKSKAFLDMALLWVVKHG